MSNANNTSKFVENSRICIKNLPKYLTTERLRKQLEPFGEITDCKVLTKDGRSRCLAFAGFKTAAAAASAVKTMNNTFIDTSRIVVEFAKPVGDETLARPWSKYSKGSSMNAKLSAVNTLKPKQAAPKVTEPKPEKKPSFIDTLVEDSMNKSKKPSWANDIDLPDDPFTAANTTKKKPTKQQEKELSEDDTEDTELPTAKKRKQSDRKADGARKSDDAGDDSMHTSGAEEATSEDEESDSAENESAEDTETAAAEPISDLDYLRSKVVTQFDDLEDENEADQSNDANVAPQNERDDDGNGSGDQANAELDANRDDDNDEEQDVTESGRLFVRNLTFMVTEDELHELFSQYGKILEVHIPVDRESKRGKGYAYVLFAFPDDARKALEATNHSIFQGRLIDVHPAKEKKKLAPVTFDTKKSASSSSYKQELLKKKRAEATSAHNWNTLFMRSDTVAQNIAQRLNISKSELLDGENAAVRLALAEAHLVQETKDVLQNEGVDFDVLRDPESWQKRSKTMFLVKNLPNDTTEEELRELFEKFGNLSKIVFPPSRTIALIEFYEPNEAKSAFRGTAYKNFKHVPLYLEWAPVSILKKNQTKTDKKDAVKKDSTDGVVRVTAAQIADEAEESATLYIKNLNFNTTEEALKELFESRINGDKRKSIAQQMGGQETEDAVKKVTLVKKPDPTTGQKRSAGYGFIEFSKLDHAVKAFKTLQDSVIDGHAIVLQYSNINKDKSATGKASVVGKSKEYTDRDGRKVTFKKISIKNIPFEATEKDLYQLFGAYSKVKKVRMPRKVYGGHRGFGFVEFPTAEECHNAYEALKLSAHLYGRRLVLEYAADETSMEALREKATKYLEADGAGSSNRKIPGLVSEDQQKRGQKRKTRPK